MSGLSLEKCKSNLKSAAVSILELLAFNNQKFRGLHDPDIDPFPKKFFAVMSGLCLGTCTSNLKKPVALTTTTNPYR